MKSTRMQSACLSNARATQKLPIITMIKLLLFCYCLFFCFCCLSSNGGAQVAGAQDIMGTGLYYAAGFNIAGPNKHDPRIKRELDYNDPTVYFKDNSLETFFDGRFTYDDYLVYSMRSNSLVAGVDTDVHRYDRRQDLLNSVLRRPSGKQRALSSLAPSSLAATTTTTTTTTSSPSSTQSSQLAARTNQTRQSATTRTTAAAAAAAAANQVGFTKEDEDGYQRAKCGRNLDAVLRESEKLFSSQDAYSKSKQLNFIDYLDSFGWPKSQVMLGNHLFLGSHEQCSRANLGKALEKYSHSEEEEEEGDNDVGLGTRYCVANYRSVNWPVVGPNEEIEQIGAQASIKLGICLPDSCNTISAGSHLNKVDSLIKLVRLNQVPYSGYKMTNLYCLPDENSPLRQFSLSARIFIVFISSWLTIVAYFSIKYELQRIAWIRAHGNPDEFLNLEASKCMMIFAIRLSWSKLFETSTSNQQSPSPPPQSIPPTSSNGSHQNLHHRQHMLSPDTRRRSNLINALRTGEHGDKLRQRVVPVADLMANGGGGGGGDDDDGCCSPDSGCLDCRRLSEISSSQQVTTREHLMRTSSTSSSNSIESNSSTIAKQQQQQQQQQVNSIRGVDLSIIDGLKVISMCWLVCAHTMMLFLRAIANGRDFWTLLKDPRYLTVLAGIYTVDTFFASTGVLTAYLKFNKSDGIEMGTTKYWLEAFVHRYIRLLPMYLLVFWYSRDVSEYTGVGPFWDYATANTSMRSVCKHESVATPLLFSANFKSIDETCVKPSWYLSNDYQFLLVTPIFMAFILKSKSLGYSVLIGGTILSLILQFYSVFYSGNWNDFQVLINFKPMFGAYILKNFWQLYVLPFNRIPPYLIGLLTGHLIYSSSKSYTAQRHLRQQQDQARQDNSHHHHHHHHLGGSSSSSSKIGFIHHQQGSSLVSSPISTHREGTKHSNRSNYYLLSSSDLINSLKGYICLNVWIPLLVLISLVYIPYFLTRFDIHFEGLTAKIGTSAVITIMRLLWSLSIARLIYISSTRFIDVNNFSKPFKNDSFILRLLSSPIWKPWSKMGLTALLVQWEVIGYLFQTQTGLPNMRVDFLLGVSFFSILWTYILTLILYITVEYPLSQVGKLYIHPFLFPET